MHLLHSLITRSSRPRTGRCTRTTERDIQGHCGISRPPAALAFRTDEFLGDNEQIFEPPLKKPPLLWRAAPLSPPSAKPSHAKAADLTIDYFQRRRQRYASAGTKGLVFRSYREQKQASFRLTSTPLVERPLGSHFHSLCRARPCMTEWRQACALRDHSGAWHRKCTEPLFRL
jgi:hypothetical protein